MIKYTCQPDFDKIENFLLSHQDEIYKTTRYLYYFKNIGDCAGIFRCTRTERNSEKLIAYYHEGEF